MSPASSRLDQSAARRKSNDVIVAALRYEYLADMQITLVL